MKKLIIIITLLFCGFSSYAQDKTTNDVLTSKDSLYIQYLDTYHEQLQKPRFKLFKTQNIWTFIKLDTMTGQLWQVQYSVDNKYSRMISELDMNDRCFSTDDYICGRFTLYETSNMYNFILLDTIDGRCWQVQWSISYNERGVWRIW